MEEKGMKNDGLWLDDLFREKLTGAEKIFKDIQRWCDEHYLLFNLRKYPLTSNKQQYTVIIAKYSNKMKKWKVIMKESNMELLPLLKLINKKLIKYHDEHKIYNLLKLGGGEWI